MKFVEIDKKIHSLLQLPEYLRSKRLELEDIDDDIKLPVMVVNEQGFLTGNCPPTDVQAFIIMARRSHLEFEINKAIDKARCLVNAINSLSPADKTYFIDYYSSDNRPIEKPNYTDVWNAYENKRNKEVDPIDENIAEIEKHIQLKESSTNNINKIAELLGV